MRPRLIVIAKGLAAYLVLSMLFGSIHSALYGALPDEGVFGSISTTALLFLAFVPALASGYLVGRLVNMHGIVSGALAITLGVMFLNSIFSGASSDISQYLVFILVGALAGGCGELHAHKKPA